MTYPDDGTMFTLLALHTGDALDADGAGLFLACETDRGRREWGVPGAVLDDLEARGWVEIGEAGPAVTDRGRYWLGRWFKRTTGRDLAATRFRKHAVGGGK